MDRTKEHERAMAVNSKIIGNMISGKENKWVCANHNGKGRKCNGAGPSDVKCSCGELRTIVL
jgi:hypothetical protein